MGSLYLIRHGEPDRRGVLVGQLDVGLSETGRKQAAAAIIPTVAAVYCSPLRRAVDTATLLAPPLPPPRVLTGLREITYGAWDGLTWGEIEARDPDLARAKLADWLAVTPPGGEAWPVFSGRVLTALEIVFSGSLPALIVAHEGTNAVIAERLTGTNPLHFRQQYAEVLSFAI